MAISTLSKSALVFSNGAHFTGAVAQLDDDTVDVMAVSGNLFLRSGINLNTFVDQFQENFVNAKSVGMIAAFSVPEAEIPTGWLVCHGQSVARSTYPALFTSIGTTYGSLNNFVFNVPDLRDYFIYQNESEPVGTTRAEQLSPPSTGHTYFIDPGLIFPGNGHTHTWEDTYFMWGGGSNNGGVDRDTDNYFILEGNRTADGPEQALRPAGSHSHTVTAVTDSESAPKHVSVIYAIKH